MEQLDLTRPFPKKLELLGSNFHSFVKCFHLLNTDNLEELLIVSDDEDLDISTLPPSVKKLTVCVVKASENNRVNIGPIPLDELSLNCLNDVTVIVHETVKSLRLLDGFTGNAVVLSKNTTIIVECLKEPEIIEAEIDDPYWGELDPESLEMYNERPDTIWDL